MFLFVFAIKLYGFFIYFGHFPLNKYTICKYFLTVSRLPFHFVDGSAKPHNHLDNSQEIPLIFWARPFRLSVKTKAANAAMEEWLSAKERTLGEKWPVDGFAGEKL